MDKQYRYVFYTDQAKLLNFHKEIYMDTITSIYRIAHINHKHPEPAEMYKVKCLRAILRDLNTKLEHSNTKLRELERILAEDVGLEEEPEESPYSLLY